ncbi:hypothetical protein [Paenibacillus jilunlii]|uniref:Uncharacterized protein n=1 Tax=Paenibacillus jilunlii TaxID=682956 RepID=A0ABR5SPE1_9BACL|nr:hypothetical protein [Paenibacillus jilunlii]KWX71244.1 hypothetical protein AML91_23670 [Paenibacillus jilunlii]
MGSVSGLKRTEETLFCQKSCFLSGYGLGSRYIRYPLFEEMHERLAQLELKEEERGLLERIDHIDQSPSSTKPWKEIRRVED